MKRRLKLLAIVSLLCGLAAAGFGAWSYFHSRTQADLSRSLDAKSMDLAIQSDTVKGTPQERRLLAEAEKYARDADDALTSAKSNSQRAVIFGIGSIVLILASVAMMMAHLKKKETD